MKTNRLLFYALLSFTWMISIALPAKISSQNIPLHILVHNGDTAAVRSLLQQGAEVNQPDDQEGLTPLMHAARSRWTGVAILRLLRQFGADVTAMDAPPAPPVVDLPGQLRQEQEALLPSSKPLLYYALEGGNRAKIEYLLAEGAPLHYQYRGGYDVLIDAVYKLPERNRYKLIQWLLEQGAPLDGLSAYGESALSVASRLGYFDLVKMFLEAGADTAQLRWSTLMHTAVFSNATAVGAELQKKPYDQERDRFGRTAFLLAVQANELENAKVLLAGGANLQERDRQGKAALAYAAAANHDEMVRWLLEQGADIAATDDYNSTALIEACAYGANACVPLLLAAGSDPKQKNDFGQTAASITDDPTLFQLLLDQGTTWREASPELRRTMVGLPTDYRPQISQTDYLAGKQRRFGSSNPEEMQVPFWKEMIRSGSSAGAVRYLFKDVVLSPSGGDPVWCYDRFGKSFTPLPDGRIIEIGGEHEDYYDADFCIYNDVIVFDGGGDFTMYSYPPAVFPPTDFHTASLVDTAIYIIGGLGYQGERQYGHTPVYRLDIHSLAIERVTTSGNNPGWIFDHQSVRSAPDQIRVSGGKICLEDEIIGNSAAFVLDLRTLTWTQVSAKNKK